MDSKAEHLDSFKQGLEVEKVQSYQATCNAYLKPHPGIKVKYQNDSNVIGTKA